MKACFWRQMEQYNNLLPTRLVPLLIPHSWAAFVFKQLIQQNAEQLNHWLPILWGIRRGTNRVRSTPLHHYAAKVNNVVQVLYQEHCLATSPGSSLLLLGIKGRAGRSPMGPSPDLVNAV